MPHSIEYIQGALRHFAEICQGRSPLYVELSSRAADHPDIPAMLTECQPGQPVANLLFAAVQYLLLEGVRHPLADFYPSVGGTRAPNEAFPAFADFCQSHRDAMTVLITLRRVQTNEVNRCGLLLPALTVAGQQADPSPLYLIDVGASLGLHLAFDRYGYDYNDTFRCGDPNGPRIRTEVRHGGQGEVPTEFPRITGRIGIDMDPVDINDESAVRWVQSLIWADQVDRIRLFQQAVEVVRRDPPKILRGDAMELLPDVIASAPPDATVCVMHSHSIYQLKRAMQAEFATLLSSLGQQRPLLEISLEWLGDNPGPQLHLIDHAHSHDIHLANCDHHGAWMDWK